MRHDRAYLLRAEVSHGDVNTPDELRRLDGVQLVEQGRLGRLPTSVITVLARAVSPVVAVEQLRTAIKAMSGDAPIFQPRPQLVRVGWVSLAEVLAADAIGGAWNWDTIDHDCTKHQVKIAYGMPAGTPIDEYGDEMILGGCMPGGPASQCRICGTQW